MMMLLIGTSCLNLIRYKDETSVYLHVNCVSSAKFEEMESNVPKISELNRLASSNPPFSARQFLAMELRLLEFFCWNVGLPTAAHFFDYFLVSSVAESDFFDGRNLGADTQSAVATMSKYVVYFLEISLQGRFTACSVKPKFHLGCHVTTRHVRRDVTSQVEFGL